LKLRVTVEGEAMASEAYERAMKRLQGPTEAELAELIMQDVSQLTENAQGSCLCESTLA
jgi:hypothetical protein